LNDLSFQECKESKPPTGSMCLNSEKTTREIFIVWHGTYRSLVEAEEKLWRCAAESRNEFYVKDLQLGIVMARGNIADTANV
jgi:hypothetical protein